jgi:hypothetical protein
MDILLLVIGGVLFTAWVIGMIVAIPSIWRKIFGDSVGHQHPLRRSFPVKRRKAF